MKRFKKVSLFIICIIVLGVYFFSDSLILFANEAIYTVETLKDGLILESGEPFSIEDKYSYAQCNGLVLSYDYDGIHYETRINVDGTLTEPMSSNSYSYYVNLNYKNYTSFTQEPGKMPYVNGKKVYWKVSNNNYYYGSYCQFGIKFVGYTYDDPDFNIYCDDDVIAANDNTNCQVSIEYHNTPKVVDFRLNSEKLNITNVTPGKGWRITDDKDKYTLEAVDIEKNKYYDSTNEIDLLEFTINSKERQAFIDEDAIVIDEIKWEDDFVEKSEHNPSIKLVQPMKVTNEEEKITTTIRTTTTTTTTKKQEKIENPKTGKMDYFIVYMLVGLLLIAGFYELKKKEVFKKL